MTPITRILRQIMGWSLILAGMLMCFVPFVPGFVLVAIGIVLLAPYIRVFRRMSAWIHKRYPHMRGPLRRFRDFKQRHRHYAAVMPEPDPNQNGLANHAGHAQSGTDSNTPREGAPK